MKTFLNVLGCIAAVIFSIVLVPLVIVFSAYCGVSSFAKPEIIVDTVSAAVQNLDMGTFLPATEDLQEIIPIEGVTTEAVEQLLASDTVSKAVGLYAQDVLDVVLKGDQAGERQFTAEALKTLVGEEIDAIVETMKPYIPEEVPTETIAQELQTLVDTHADTLVEALPVPTLPEHPEDGTGEMDIFTTVRQILNPLVTTYFILGIAILAIFIYLCRFPRFGGMMWLGVDAAVCALFTTLLAVMVKGSLVLSLLSDLDPTIATLIDPVVTVFSRNFTVSAIVCGVLAVALIVGCVLLRRKFVNPAPALVEPTITDTPVSE